MRGHILSRCIRYLLSGAAVLILNFALPRMMPGDPIVHLLGTEDYYKFPALAAELKQKYGLDQPLTHQFVRYASNLAGGDLGYSFRYSRPVADVVVVRLKWTLVLVLPALVLGALAAAVTGSLAGWFRGTSAERAFTLSVLLVKSMPQYGLAILGVVLFSFHLGIFPIGGVGATAGNAIASGLNAVWHAALPVLVLSMLNAGQWYLVVRNDIAELKWSPFIVTARSRGLSQIHVLFRHALRHALAPFATLVGLGLGFAVSGALLVEIVFSWPGMGTLILSAVESRDYPLLQACFLLLTLSVMAANFATDLLYGWFDPRVKDR